MEDMDTRRIALERQLEELGYPYRSAPSRQELVELYWAGTPYAMILDNNVPRDKGGQIDADMGLYLSMTFKRKFPEMKIALHTETRLNPEIQKAVDMGVAYIIKPVSTKDLKDFLEA